MRIVREVRSKKRSRDETATFTLSTDSGGVAHVVVEWLHGDVNEMRVSVHTVPGGGAPETVWQATRPLRGRGSELAHETNALDRAMLGAMGDIMGMFW